MFLNTIQIRKFKYPIKTLSKFNMAILLIKIIFTLKSILYYYILHKFNIKMYFENILTLIESHLYRATNKTKTSPQSGQQKLYCLER